MKLPTRIAINAIKKIGTWISSLLLCSEVVLIFTNLPPDLAWNTIVIPGLLPVTVAWT